MSIFKCCRIDSRFPTAASHLVRSECSPTHSRTPSLTRFVLPQANVSLRQSSVTMALTFCPLTPTYHTLRALTAAVEFCLQTTVTKATYSGYLIMWAAVLFRELGVVLTRVGVRLGDAIYTTMTKTKWKVLFEGDILIQASIGKKRSKIIKQSCFF